MLWPRDNTYVRVVFVSGISDACGFFFFPFLENVLAAANAF